MPVVKASVLGKAVPPVAAVNHCAVAPVLGVATKLDTVLAAGNICVASLIFLTVTAVLRLSQLFIVCDT